MKLIAFSLVFALVCLLQIELGQAVGNFTTRAPVTAPIDYHEEKNSKGEILYRILHGNQIQIQNWYRPSKPSLKFTLKNVHVESLGLHGSLFYDFNINDTTRLRIDIRDGSYPFNEKSTQYFIEWYGGGKDDAARELCVHYGDSQTSWYNTYQSAEQKWPMEPTKATPRSSFNALMEFDNQDAQGEYFYILEQSFVNTDGFAVSMNDLQPLFVRRDPNQGDPQLCFSVNGSAPYDPTSENPDYRRIRMWVFTGINIRNVTDYLVHKTAVIPKPTEIPDEAKFTYPSSYIDAANQEELLQYAANLDKYGLKHNEIIYSGHLNIRNYGFDEKKFPRSDEMVQKVQNAGHRFALKIVPEYDPEHSVATQKHFLQHSNESTKAEKETAIRILDLSRPDTCDYYSGLLKKLKYELDIHSFVTGSLNLRHLQMENGYYPNSYAKNYLKTVAGVVEKNLTSLIAYKAQHLPMFVQLSANLKSNPTDLLQSIIPGVLAVSIGGYPFVSPKPIYSNGPKPLNVEIYIRWLQAVALMPQITFDYSAFPWDYSDQTIALTKKFTELHAEHAPTIIQLARKRVQFGVPIIRPMWYHSPDDAKTFKIADQFMLGEDILVAPVVQLGARERTVYLPAGIWIDQHGKSFSGPGEIKVAAPLEELPFFKRKIVA